MFPWHAPSAYNPSVASANSTDILILSCSIGSGHMRASAAIEQGVRLLDPGRECLIVDFPREVSPKVEALLHKVYLDSLKLMPAAYGRIYRLSELQAARTGTSNRITDASERLQRLSELWDAGYEAFNTDNFPATRFRNRSLPYRTLRRLAGETGASALIAPHFYGAGILGNYKKQNPDVFAAVVLTDYVPHPMGVPPNLDLYIVADDEAAAEVEKLGAPPDRIHPTGIPIDPAFEQPADPKGVRRDLLGFPEVDEDDLPVVMVMGGGLGGGHLDAVVGSLLEASAAMRLVILCGSNERSRVHLQDLASTRGRSATFLGFTDRVRDLLAASSVLVTKPGGMSCTEALAVAIPQVLINPIPGQEEDNAAAMVRYGAAVMTERTQDVLGETLKVLTSPRHRRNIVESARAAHRPHSAESAARLVLERLR